MKRIRHRIDGSAAIYPVRPWTVDNNTTAHGGAPIGVGCLDPDYYDRFMIDHVAKGARHYQDCTSSTRARFYLERRDDLGNRVDVAHIADTPLNGVSDRYVSGYPISRLVDSFSAADYFKPYDLSVLGNRNDYEWTFSNSSIPTKVTIDRDPFDTNFSVWYLVVDVFQLRGLFASLFSTIVQKARFRALTDRDPRKTAKQFANDHLAVQFGLLPTIADLQKFCHLILNWQKRYDDLKGFLESTRAWHAEPYALTQEYPLEQFSIWGTTAVDAFAITQLPILEARVTVNDRSFRRTASYSFSAPEFRGWSTRLKQFLDAFGVIDPAAIWDVIPFSFIVDWFFGVGNWLHKNRPRLFPADVIIRDYCESKRVVLDVKWFMSYAGTTSGSPPLSQITGDYLGSDIYTTYLRKRFHPPSVSIPSPRLQGSGITLSRALISASLIAQRIPAVPRQ